MAHTIDWARRLLRELPKDPKRLLKSRSYADPTFLELFFEWLDDLIFHDPRAALEWARIVPDLASRSPEEDGSEGRQQHQEHFVRAWAILGSAYRAAGQPDEAEAPYQVALKLAESKAVSDVVRADTDRRLSTLRACQGRPKEGLELVCGAEETLRKADEASHTLLIKALISKSYILTIKLGRHSEAIDCGGEALSLAGNPESSPVLKRIHQSACNNLAFAISASSSFGDQKKALWYVQQALDLLKGMKKRTAARYRLQWVEALIWNRIGMHAKAEKLYRRALEGFEALKLPWEIALVGLDLGSLLHLVGDLIELEKIASQTFKQFRLLSGADRQTLAALSLWVDAVRSRGWEAAGDDGQARRNYDALHEKARQMILAGVFAGRSCKGKTRR